MGAPTPTHDAFLGLLEAGDVEALHAAGRLRRYRPGDHLMRQGARADSVIVLLDGRVKVSLDTADGRTVILTVFRQGDLIGEFEALGDYEFHTANVISLDDMACRVFTQAEFRRYLIAHPTAALALVHVMIHRLGAADRRRIDTTASDATRGLARFLLEVASSWKAPEGTAGSVPLTQHELASLIGVSRNSVVRALTTLRGLGLVDTAPGVVTIREPARLRSFAD